MSFGNVRPATLVGAVEKLLAKMDETILAGFYQRELSTMPPETTRALTEALFAAFRDRGESSEDVAEAAGTTLDSLERGEPDALRALLAYAAVNADLLKEATAILVESRSDLVATLPAQLRAALAQSL